MKTLLALLALASPSMAGDKPMVWKQHVVWSATDSTSYERSAYIERASCNHLIALPPEKIYKQVPK